MSMILQVRAADVAWFDDNPDRRIRVRLLAPGEFGEDFLPHGDNVKAMLLYRFVPNKIAAWAVSIDRLPEDTDAGAFPLMIEIGQRVGLSRSDA